MFIAALLDDDNAAELHRKHTSGFGQGNSVTFVATTITASNRAQVRDFGRELEPGPVPMALGGSPGGVESRILAMAGSFAATAHKVIAIAREDKVPLERVCDAMRAAASDSTDGDRAFAGAAYVIARRAGLSIAEDVLRGRVKIDEVPPSSIQGTAEYVNFGTGTHKGDTIYLPTRFDVASLAYQGLLVHELTHAARDRLTRLRPAHRRSRSSTSRSTSWRATEPRVATG